MEYHTDRIVAAGCRVIGLVARAILVSGMRIAHAKELRSLRMLVDPENCCLEDMDILGTLQEPHVKLAYELICDIQDGFLTRYQELNELEEEDVLTDEAVEDLAGTLVWRFVFRRRKYRRRDRYYNFNQILFTAQRALYEWCKLMLSGESRAGDMSYRCNYTAGRLKALIKDCTDSNVQLMVQLIYELKACESKSRNILTT